MSRFGGGPSGLQGEPLALSSKIKTLWRERNHEIAKQTDRETWFDGFSTMDRGIKTVKCRLQVN